MKFKYSMPISYILLFFLVFVSFAILKIKQIHRLEKELLIETAKVDFIKRGGSFDSVYVNGDTISFYNNKILQGKNVRHEAR